MRGDAEIIEALNDLLSAELTAINQYYIHYKMCENWGFGRLAAYHRKESLEEMKHADEVIERILFLEGVPNMQRLNPVSVGEDAVEQLELMLTTELEAVARLNGSVDLARRKNDNGSRELFERLLTEEEEAVDHLEAQLGLIRTLGREHYLAQQLHG
ncbi:MAG: bacterioferritin [Planctomycetes bacterium]|nr:bacterioferritin [Planctomycetota bacterium]